MSRMSWEEKKYWMAWQAGMGTDAMPLAVRVLEAYGSLGAFWAAKDTAALPEVSQSVREKLVHTRRQTEPDRLVELCLRTKTGVLCFLDSDYPEAMQPYADRPMVLYYQGEPAALARPAASVVGSRRCSAYGRTLATRFAAAFAAAGMCVVSGMAKGIDASAHEGALAGPGSTIAVLGCGPDVIYPQENRDLYLRIRERGLILSEYPPGVRPEAWHFPLRNRIISGLGRFLLLVEGEARSGALITCAWAAEQGKDVWAIAGPVTNPYSIAPLKLIQDGAFLAITPDDVLKNYFPGRYGASVQQSLFLTEKEARATLSLQEKRLLNMISFLPVHVNLLLKNRQESPLLDKNLYLDLTKLLSLRLIEKLPGDYYQRI